MTRKSATVLTLVAAAALASVAAFGTDTARAATLTATENAPAGVLSLSAQASDDVPQDVVDITLFYEQEAADAASLTDALNKRTAAALAQAKSASGVSARTGAFSIYPWSSSILLGVFVVSRLLTPCCFGWTTISPTSPPSATI